MIDVMDLDPEESREVEDLRLSRSLDPTTREAEAGSSKGLVRAL